MALSIVLSDLAAIGGVNHIKWSWSIADPNQNGLPYLEAEATEVWVAEVNNRELAFKAGEGLIDFIQAGLGLGQTFYGWIRARARNGEFTEFEPADVASGVAGTVSAGGTGITLPDDSVLPQHLDADTAPKQLLMRDRLNFVSRAGDTMTGLLNLSGAPTANPHATTKQYVDENIAAALANVAFDGQYTVKTVLTEADPGTGNMQFNTANQFDATELYISAIGAGGNDLSNLWRKVDVGRVITMQQANDASKNVKFDVTGPAVDHVTWFTIPVATVSFNNMPIANNIDVLMHVSGSTGDQYYLPLSGGTMTGALTLSGAPTINLHAATKQYVDDAVTAGGGYSDEQAQDAVAAMLVAGTNITLSYNDVANTLTINASGGAGVDTAANYVWTGTHQFTNTVRVDNVFTLDGTNPHMMFKAAVGTNSGTITAQKDNKNRWQIIMPNNAAETGGDIGSNFNIYRWDDLGTTATAAMTIYRYSNLLEYYGDITINRPTGNAALTIISAAAAANARVTSAGGFTATIDTNPGTGTAVGALRALRAGALRWSMEFPNAADNFSLKRYPDAVEVIGIDRTTGLITVESNIFASTAPSAGEHLTNKTYVDGAISTAGGSYQPLDATLTALAGLSSTVGLVEQTGADAFTKRGIGVAAAVNVLTRGDGDARYQMLDATLTALAELSATAGLVEQTGADAFTKRGIGVAAAANVLTRGDGDARYAAIADLGNYLPLAGGDLSGDLRIIKTNPALTLRKSASGETSVFYGEKGTTKRWGLHLGNGALESTGNLGSIFAIERFNDAGSSLDTPFIIDRDTGIVGILNGITVPATPGAGNEATSKSYVDAVDALKAPLASPALTGVPTAPTAAEGVTTTQIATCAFVNNALVGNYLPLTGGTLTNTLMVQYSAPIIHLNKTISTGGYYNEIRGNTVISGTPELRWRMFLGNATAENEAAGTNEGSDFQLTCYNDAAGLIASPMIITRATGDMIYSKNIALSLAPTLGTHLCNKTYVDLKGTLAGNNTWTASNFYGADQTYPARFGTINSNGEIIVRYDTPGFPPLLTFQNFGIDGANRGIGNNYVLAKNNGTQITCAQMFVLSAGTWDTGSASSGFFRFNCVTNGSALLKEMDVGSGVLVGDASGGLKGRGLLNAVGVYDDNVLLTCYVLDAARNGRVDTERFDRLSRTGKNEQAKAFTARLDELDVRAYARKWRETPGPLPGFPPLPSEGPVENVTPLGQWINKTMECLELQAVHIAQLSDEIDALTAQIAAMQDR